MKALSDDTLKTIERIAKRLAPRFRFGYHETEDIYQQAVIFGIEALASYDSKRPLENYLAVVVANKLKSFKRDNYIRLDATSKHCEAKKNLMEPIPIDNVDDEMENSMRVHENVASGASRREILAIIDNNIPSELRSDYLKLKHGMKIVKSRKKLIEAAIIEIVEKYGWQNEEE